MARLEEQGRAYIDALFALSSYLQHRWNDTWREDEWREYEALERAVEDSRDAFDDAKREASEARVT